MLLIPMLGLPSLVCLDRCVCLEVKAALQPFWTFSSEVFGEALAVFLEVSSSCFSSSAFTLDGVALLLWDSLLMLSASVEALLSSPWKVILLGAIVGFFAGGGMGLLGESS